MQLVAAVADTVRWSVPMRELADKILAGMKAKGVDVFNAVHFRIEKDAKDWTQIMGGIDVRISIPCL